MLSEALALVTALTNALGVVLIARGMRGSAPTVAAFYSVAVQAALLTALLLTRLPPLDLYAVGLFALSGLLALGLGRLLNFQAMKGMGVARTSALVGSNPVITTALSMALLGEQPTASTILGTLTVASGVALISGARGFTVDKPFLIGLASALSYSLSNIAGKAGLIAQPDPFLSAQAGAAAGLLFYVLYFAASRQSLRVGRESLGYFAATGVLSSAGWLAMMKALELGAVSTVTTIVFSYPLISLVLARLLIREEELTMRTLAGSVLVVVGVAAVILL